MAAIYLPCPLSWEDLVSASRRRRKRYLSASPRSNGGHFIYLVLFLGRIWEATAEGVEKVSECMTTCTHGSHFIYFVLFLGRIWRATAEGIEKCI
jgi:hypothetical protein